MTINTQTQGNKARMIISDPFDSSVYKEFKNAYAPLLADPAVHTIAIDLSGTKYLDSAALGMLVQLDAVAKSAKKTVTLISVPGRVSEILKVANADKLFSINLPSGMKLDLGN
ncbi:MAG TPA: STAS domain-containing protein [Gallionella sp.]|nr:STAS domain-containing protein [Gallionella sp.]